ncbi:MAG TPA: OB-fold domain-containing protein, partial [Rubrobacteraceae bacterium]|nr:OB-fold domain-containing protein [Rubrobacteraceae bacterium]
GSMALGWRISGGRGIVYATTAVYRRDGEPYNVALVDLEEGLRMMSRVEGLPPEEVEVGLRVMLEVREEDDGPVAVFVPAAEQVRGACGAGRPLWGWPSRILGRSARASYPST